MHGKINCDLLEKTCKNAIETILFCLEHAIKGTYSIVPMPALQAVRVTSAIRASKIGLITWGLSETSACTPPGRNWEEYRNQPGHPLEAMRWCVERQKSWTADDPNEVDQLLSHQALEIPHKQQIKKIFTSLLVISKTEGQANMMT